MKLSSLIQKFLAHYLPHIKGVSPLTVKTYRDAFKLFLPFAANYHHIRPESLTVEHLCADLILAFLDGLEKREKTFQDSQPKACSPQILCQNAAPSIPAEHENGPHNP